VNAIVVSTPTPVPPAGFFDLELLLAPLGLKSRKWARETVRKLAERGVLAPDEFTQSELRKIGRGRPETVYFLSLTGALALAAYAATPEAAAWRGEQMRKLAAAPPRDETAALHALRASNEALLAEVQGIRLALAALPALRTKARRFPTSAAEIDGDALERGRAWLRLRPLGAEVTIHDVAVAIGARPTPTNMQHLQLLLREEAWKVCGLLKTRGHRLRLYRRTL